LRRFGQNSADAKKSLASTQILRERTEIPRFVGTPSPPFVAGFVFLGLMATTKCGAGLRRMTQQLA
jgi:hypothetical protein